MHVKLTDRTTSPHSEGLATATRGMRRFATYACGREATDLKGVVALAFNANALSHHHCPL